VTHRQVRSPALTSLDRPLGSTFVLLRGLDCVDSDDIGVTQLTQASGLGHQRGGWCLSPDTSAAIDTMLIHIYSYSILFVFVLLHLLILIVILILIFCKVRVAAARGQETTAQVVQRPAEDGQRRPTRPGPTAPRGT